MNGLSLPERAQTMPVSGSSASTETAHYMATAAHNPLQFVKVQSPLDRKDKQQIQLTKEVKLTREALKEREEEWQTVCMSTTTDWTFNLDKWKSRRRMVSWKVLQRAEEMRQIEAEEQLKLEQYQQQQRKIKKFSEIVENRSSPRSYNFDLYIGQGNDSGLGGTPEPDDTIDKILKSDTSEGMNSDAESIDSDIHKAEKMLDKEPSKVPQKNNYQLNNNTFFGGLDDIVQTSSILNFSRQLPIKNLSSFDNFSSTEPSEVEGICGDNETVSSEEYISHLATDYNSAPHINTLYDQNEDDGIGKRVINQQIEDTSPADIQITNKKFHSFNISIKAGDRGFGFTLKEGKDQRYPPYIDTVIKCT